MNKTQKILLTAIILAAAILRLWKLGEVPPSPDWDEAALGYNAYSIMQTGRDEFGKLLPIVLRSFDDYKPALYAYLAIPSIAIFGLNTFAVRLPSAIFGILTVLATYFLVIELFRFRIQDSGFRKKKNYVLRVTCYGLLSAVLVAISPWHLQFSRIAFESNVGLAFNIFGLLFFLKGLKKSGFLFVSSIFYALSLYTYQSEKVFVPLILTALILIHRKKLLKNIKQTASAGLLFVLLIFPLIFITFSNPYALLRAKGVSVFADQTPFLAKSVERLTRDHENQNLLGLIFDNRRVTYAISFINGYLSHFDLNWLFITGDQPRHQPPNFGHLYLFELPFLLIGIYSMIFGSPAGGFAKKTKQLIFVWFFIAPIPAALTTGIPHPIRTLNFLPTFQIFTAIGILKVYFQISIKKILYSIFYILYSIFIFFNFVYYLDQYFIQQNYFRSDVWQYGYKQVVGTVEKIKNQYDEIIITNKPHLDQSYMFFLFYTKYDPKIYLKEGGTKSGGFAEINRFSKYVFRPIDWNNEKKNNKTLYVGRPDDFPSDATVIKTVNFLDGRPAIKIVKK